MSDVLLHPKQFAVWEDPRRHQFLLAGRRGGKTALLRERLIKAVRQSQEGVDTFYIGPSLQDAKDIIWDSLEERLDQMKWRCRPLISKSRFEFSRNRKLYVIGAEKIRRIRGHKVGFSALDEVAFYEKPLLSIWRAIRPALADVKGSAWIATTPNGKGTDAYDFYMQIAKRPDIWGYHYWTSLDNPWMDQQEIEGARHEMDEKSFKQEYMATWESFVGLAWYNFEESLHIKPCSEIDVGRPMDLCFDFNVNPTTMLIAQDNGRILQFKREYSFSHSSTLQTVKAFCEDFRQHPNRQVRIYGDSAGNNRHANTGFSDYHYVKEVLTQHGFQFQYCVLGANPPIVDRVSHMNSWLKNSLGASRIEVDPSCTDLIRDLASQELDGRIPSEKNNLGHKAAAASYYVHWKHIMSTRTPSRTILL